MAGLYETLAASIVQNDGSTLLNSASNAMDSYVRGVKARGDTLTQGFKDLGTGMDKMSQAMQGIADNEVDNAALIKDNAIAIANNELARDDKYYSFLDQKVESKHINNAFEQQRKAIEEAQINSGYGKGGSSVGYSIVNNILTNLNSNSASEIDNEDIMFYLKNPNAYRIAVKEGKLNPIAINVIESAAMDKDINKHLKKADDLYILEQQDAQGVLLPGTIRNVAQAIYNDPEYNNRSGLNTQDIYATLMDQQNKLTNQQGTFANMQQSWRAQQHVNDVVSSFPMGMASNNNSGTNNGVTNNGGTQQPGTNTAGSTNNAVAGGNAVNNGAINNQAVPQSNMPNEQNNMQNEQDDWDPNRAEIDNNRNIILQHFGKANDQTFAAIFGTTDRDAVANDIATNGPNSIYYNKILEAEKQIGKDYVGTAIQAQSAAQNGNTDSWLSQIVGATTPVTDLASLYFAFRGGTSLMRAGQKAAPGVFNKFDALDMMSSVVGLFGDKAQAYSEDVLRNSSKNSNIYKNPLTASDASRIAYASQPGAINIDTGKPYTQAEINALKNQTRENLQNLNKDIANKFNEIDKDNKNYPTKEAKEDAKKRYIDEKVTQHTLKNDRNNRDAIKKFEEQRKQQLKTENRRIGQLYKAKSKPETPLEKEQRERLKKDALEKAKQRHDADVDAFKKAHPIDSHKNIKKLATDVRNNISDAHESARKKLEAERDRRLKNGENPHKVKEWFTRESKKLFTSVKDYIVGYPNIKNHIPFVSPTGSKKYLIGDLILLGLGGNAILSADNPMKPVVNYINNNTRWGPNFQAAELIGGLTNIDSDPRAFINNREMRDRLANLQHLDPTAKVPWFQGGSPEMRSDQDKNILTRVWDETKHVINMNTPFGFAVPDTTNGTGIYNAEWGDFANKGNKLSEYATTLNMLEDIKNTANNIGNQFSPVNVLSMGDQSINDIVEQQKSIEEKANVARSQGQAISKALSTEETQMVLENSDNIDASVSGTQVNAITLVNSASIGVSSDKFGGEKTLNPIALNMVTGYLGTDNITIYSANDNIPAREAFARNTDGTVKTSEASLRQIYGERTNKFLSAVYNSGNKIGLMKYLGTTLDMNSKVGLFAFESIITDPDIQKAYSLLPTQILQYQGNPEKIREIHLEFDKLVSTRIATVLAYINSNVGNEIDGVRIDHAVQTNNHKNIGNAKIANMVHATKKALTSDLPLVGQAIGKAELNIKQFVENHLLSSASNSVLQGLAEEELFYQNIRVSNLSDTGKAAIFISGKK